MHAHQLLVNDAVGCRLRVMGLREGSVGLAWVRRPGLVIVFEVHRLRLLSDASVVGQVWHGIATRRAG